MSGAQSSPREVLKGCGLLGRHNEAICISEWTVAGDFEVGSRFFVGLVEVSGLSQTAFPDRLRSWQGTAMTAVLCLSLSMGSEYKWTSPLVRRICCCELRSRSRS